MRRGAFELETEMGTRRCRLYFDYSRHVLEHQAHVSYLQKNEELLAFLFRVLVALTPDLVSSTK